MLVLQMMTLLFVCVCFDMVVIVVGGTRISGSIAGVGAIAVHVGNGVVGGGVVVGGVDCWVDVGIGCVSFVNCYDVVVVVGYGVSDDVIWGCWW